MQNMSTGVVTLYMKGADAVMANIVQYNDWLDEEVINTSPLSHSLTHTHSHTHTHSVVTWLERDSEHWLWVNES